MGNGEWEMKIEKWEIVVSVLIILKFGCCCSGLGCSNVG